ncbi:MAG: hypothetical protein PHI90_07000 [Clostridia bacterium]|nr:hypothetical protein [Clostridia bacterium]
MVKIKNNFKPPSCFITGIIIGLICGTVFFTLLVCYRINDYCENIKYLETVIEDKDARLVQLEKSINKNKFILEDIEIYLENMDQELDKLTFKKFIKEKYSSLIGKEVNSIDADMTVEIIDDRIFKLSNKEYQLKVTRLIMTNILKIWIKVSPGKASFDL